MLCSSVFHSGIRVAKGSLTSFSCNFATNGFSATKSYVLGPGGEQVTEYAVSSAAGNYASAWQHTNAFSGGKIQATYHDTGTYFYLGDWLGSKRVEVGTGSNGIGCATGYASLPYGDGLSTVALPGYSTCPDATEHHFTQKERDAESGNDYFFARYYNSAIGRFTTPDWSAKTDPVPYAVFTDPQSLNLYAYVRNNPLIHVDADGHECKSGQVACQAMEALHRAEGIINPPNTPLPPPAAPGLPAGVVHLTYWNNAPRLSPKVERKLQKELGKPGVMEATIGYTTNGKHSPDSNHYKGLAADIESINGTPMTDKALNLTPNAYALAAEPGAKGVVVGYATSQGRQGEACPRVCGPARRQHQELLDQRKRHRSYTDRAAHR